MNYNEFVDVIFEVVKKELPEGIVLKRNDVLKNNGKIKRGILFTEEGLNAFPTFYLESFYELFNEGMDIGEIAENILASYYKSRLTEQLDMRFFLDFNEAKNSIYLKLINYDLNKELLKDVPYEKYMDLALVAYYKIDDKRVGDGSILIKYDHLLKWGIEMKELIAIGKENTRYKMEYSIQNIGSLLKEIAGKECDIEFLMDNKPEMFILTNIQRCFGAVFMIYNDIMDEFCKMFNEDCCVIPSSVHEVIVVPSSETPIESIDEMIKEVNRDHVNIEERLSDHAYLYRSVGGFSV